MITVVTGLPRSGTSLMMQMLQAGGLALLTDGVREADEDNPRGYLEFEPVKHLKQDNSWLRSAEGKAVKVISLLLFDLPPTLRYRVIFMTRDLDEILASQRQMLRRRGAADAGPGDAEMRRHFEKHLARVRRFLERSLHMEPFWCSFNELVGHPRVMVPKIVQFLGADLDPERMIAAVDPGLYRQRLAAEEQHRPAKA